MTQRITQYNKQVGQPRGGLINPNLLTTAQFDDGNGQLEISVENLHSATVGTAVDYLTRLGSVRTTDVEDALGRTFTVSLQGAQRIAEHTEHVSAAADAQAALLELNFTEQPDGTIAFDIDDTAVRVACHLASYDVGKRAGVAFYNSITSLTAPDDTTTAHIWMMASRAQTFFASYGPITNDGFVFADRERHFLKGDRGGYTDVVDSGDGDFLTADTLWDFKVSKAKPTKDQTLQLLMYFLMGQASKLPEFATQTHVGLFNPRLNTVHQLAVADVPSDVIDTIRYDVIGYER